MYNPADIVLRFGDPEDALYEFPTKVLVDNESTPCFFKQCNSTSRDGQNDDFLGLLLTPIDIKAAGPLSCCISPIGTRWATQIEAAVSALHKAGIVWGDVKAENVLVDRDDNAWIIDFGGGYTRGWLDADLAGTV
ncbi:hypothetical protein B0T26DRAFT_754385 [Lasiosphaeria miniovina]|uniref:Protein kinase domain-containing protein n=1 Tax=Lasiosphaeria miniovina TaxID=1954250 RepID=A0AA40DMG8_9PEZI|nr:uncharacterized protein B0T26DRAFT_754385 [Lasiosphaeria miniovina]KAK0709129.1 hypothetical protein B0T26DRAFT_754385 [Lasiosphaeria miniovina]